MKETASATSLKSATEARWWRVAALSALACGLLIALGVYIVNRQPSTVDQIVILTVPSGAEVSLNDISYGQTPVKIEKLPVGTYTLTITKDEYKTVSEEVNIAESRPFEYKLQFSPPSDVGDLPLDQRIREFEQRATDAFAASKYVFPLKESAYYYARLIEDLDSTNPFAKDMLERIRVQLHNLAQEAMQRGDIAEAKDTYNILRERYPDDTEARSALWGLERQLASKRGEVSDWIRKAEIALQRGNLIEPPRASAYHFARQALAIEQTSVAQTILRQVRDSLVQRGEQYYANGETDAAIRQLQLAANHFRDDQQIRTRLNEWRVQRERDSLKGSDALARKQEGLKKHTRGDWEGAIQDLEYALLYNQGTTDVRYALADSYKRLGHFDQASEYFRRLSGEGNSDPNRSAIVDLGDIALQRGDPATALRYYQTARELGGSTRYSIAEIDNRIERIEKKQREKDAEPAPITLEATHRHGGFGFGDRSCKGTLTVSGKGVRYQSKEHNFSANVMTVNVTVKNDEIIVYGLHKGEQRFKLSSADAERFRETIGKYQRENPR